MIIQILLAQLSFRHMVPIDTSSWICILFKFLSVVPCRLYEVPLGNWEELPGIPMTWALVFKRGRILVIALEPANHQNHKRHLSSGGGTSFRKLWIPREVLWGYFKMLCILGSLKMPASCLLSVVVSSSSQLILNMPRASQHVSFCYIKSLKNLDSGDI